VCCDLTQALRAPSSTTVYPRAPPASARSRDRPMAPTQDSEVLDRRRFHVGRGELLGWRAFLRRTRLAVTFRPTEAPITVCDRLGRIRLSYWLLGTNPQSGPEFVQGPDAPAGHAASVADSWLPLPVVGVIVMTVNTRTPSRVAGSDNVTCTGKLEKVPSAQSGSQLLMLWDAVPMAFVMVQLLQ
jgi:hypothetical protein